MSSTRFRFPSLHYTSRDTLSHLRVVREEQEHQRKHVHREEHARQTAEVQVLRTEEYRRINEHHGRQECQEEQHRPSNTNEGRPSHHPPAGPERERQ